MEKFVGQVLDDPCEVARMLLDQFGSLNGVIAASDQRLRQELIEHPRLSDLLLSSRRFFSYATAQTRVGQPISPTDEHLHRYLIEAFDQLDKEHVLAIFLDATSLFIRVEFIAIGEIQSAVINPMQIFARAFDLSARQIIIAHNHPSNYPEPSEDDIQTTHALKKLCSIMGINFVDHFIVTDGSVFSMREANLI